MTALGTMVATKVAVTEPAWLASLRDGGRTLPHSGSGWLNTRRAAALERANALSVPTTHDEEWRFTDLAPLRKLSLRAPDAVPGKVAGIAGDVLAQTAAPEAATVLTFIDGQYAPQWSRGTDGAVSTLTQGLAQHGAAVEPYLARLAGFERDVFVALNTAWLRDGALVVLGRDTRLDSPVHLRFITTQGGAATCPRVLVVAERGAQCTLVEDYAAVGEADAYFTNAVTEIAVAPGAEVRHIRLQREAPQAMHIGTVAVTVAQDARYITQSAALGARLSRLNLDIRQGGTGCEVRIDGLALIDGEQVADTHSAMDHAFPHGSCTQLHKTIVGGAAHAVFNGKVLVREGAQLTQAAQQSRNLLLSPRARIDTKPQLEIFADDVKCAHGATVGQLDAEQLFYLVSRGLPEDHARSLLTYAFGAEIVERIPVPSLVAQLRQAVMRGTHLDLKEGVR